MHELTCPSCNAPSQYNLEDYLFMCVFCSATFKLNKDNGQKEMYGEHFIIANSADPRQINDLTLEWLRRIHHNADSVEREFVIRDIKGYSIPFWVVSLEAHTVWKGLVERGGTKSFSKNNNPKYLMEKGKFKRSYRWCISARENICEYWGMTRLHEPEEPVQVDWDGFPLDSTFSRGRLLEESRTQRETSTGEMVDVSAYEVREFFEYKYSNGVPIQSIQVQEEEAVRRVSNQVNRYHYELSKLYADILIDCRSNLEIAGIQLIHMPFWFAKYYYQPKSLLQHFHSPKEKNVVFEGFGSGVLKGELAMVRKDKLFINAIVCFFSSIILFLLGAIWHPAFYVVSIFSLIITGISTYIGFANKKKKEIEKMRKEFNTNYIEGKEAPI